jgi:fructose-1,6-bisphosphatase-3
MNRILKEFDLDENNSHIINGHVPVKVIKGESPVKADGKLIVIDGGMSEAYQKVTGIAGYTLISNSYGLLLVAHQPFESKQKAIEEETDILSTHELLSLADSRKRIADTDNGESLKRQIFELKMLLSAFYRGFIKERR